MTINSSNVTWATVNQSHIVHVKSPSVVKINAIQKEALPSCRAEANLTFTAMYAALAGGFICIGIFGFSGISGSFCAVFIDISSSLFFVAAGKGLYIAWKDWKAKKIIEEDEKGDYRTLRALFSQAEQEIEQLLATQKTIGTAQSING